MNRTVRLAPLALAAILVSLLAAEGCSTSSKSDPATKTATVAATATAPPNTATRTFTNTPVPTNTPLVSYTSTPCGTAACTPAAFYGYPLVGSFTIYPSPTPQLIGTLNLVCGEWRRFHFLPHTRLPHHFTLWPKRGTFLKDNGVRL